MGQIMTSHLSLAGLGRRWNSDRDLNNCVVVGFDLVVLILGVLLSNICVKYHISICKLFPSLILGRALRV